MRIRVPAAALLALLLAGPAPAAEPSEGVVTDYEARLDEISREILEVRRELEALVAEVASGDLGRVFVFVKGSGDAFPGGGATLTVDGKTVFSRALTPEELAVLDRGLPLEVADLWLPAGEHRVALVRPGQEAVEPQPLAAQRGRVSSWVGTAGEAGVEWRAESPPRS